jgi:hypothetical protein
MQTRQHLQGPLYMAGLFWVSSHPSQAEGNWESSSGRKLTDLMQCLDSILLMWLKVMVTKEERRTRQVSPGPGQLYPMGWECRICQFLYSHSAWVTLRNCITSCRLSWSHEILALLSSAEITANLSQKWWWKVELW